MMFDFSNGGLTEQSEVLTYYKYRVVFVDLSELSSLSG